MSKKSLWSVLLGFSVVVMGQTASAETPSDFDLGAVSGKAQTSNLKIGVVDVMSLIDKSAQMEQARKKMEKEFSPREKKLNGEKEEVNKMQEKLTKEAEVMSEDEQKKITKEVMKRVRDIKQEEEELRADFNQARNEEMGKLQKSISEAIRSLAKEEHFDLILHEGVVFASDAINVTAKVGSRLEGSGGAATAAPAKAPKR
ncbi:MAG: OmpH family outer membrane protein [Candidatus Methylumidiphilus sp.]